MQTTFLNAHRALQRGVVPEAELAWLFKIAHNVCLTRRRSSWRRGRVESPSDLGAVQDVLQAPAREPADELIRLPDALAGMPESQRRAILLREWQGLSYREIASELRLSQAAVETLIFRARRTLASRLALEPERASLVGRIRKAFDAGTLLAALRSLFEGGAAVKAAATAVAVSGVAVAAASQPDPFRHPAPDAAAAAPRQSRAVVSAMPVVAIAAPAGGLARAVPAEPKAAKQERGRRGDSASASSGHGRSGDTRGHASRSREKGNETSSGSRARGRSDERPAPSHAVPAVAVSRNAPPSGKAPAAKPKKRGNEGRGGGGKTGNGGKHDD